MVVRRLNGPTEPHRHFVEHRAEEQVLGLERFSVPLSVRLHYSAIGNAFRSRRFA